MATMTIRIPYGKHQRLKHLAQAHGISLNKLVEEWAAMAIAQFDAESRFHARAGRGRIKRGLALLDKLDAALSKHPPNGKKPRK